MKAIFLSLSTIFSLFLTIFLMLITFSNLHTAQFDLSFNQSLASLFLSAMFFVVSLIELKKNS